MPKYKFEAGGKAFEIESPTPLSDQDIAHIASKTFGAAKPTEPAAAKAEPRKESVAGIVGRNLATIPGKAGHALKVAAGLESPESMEDVGLMVAAPVPAVMAGGALASKLLPQAPKVAAALGRAAGTGGLRLAESALKGEAPDLTALRDAGISLGTEAVLGAAGLGGEKLSRGLSKAREAFKSAPERIQGAWEAVKDRMPTAKVVIPALGKGKLALEDAIDKLGTLEGKAYQQALGEIRHWMNHLDLQKMRGGPPPLAGDLFSRWVDTARDVPTGTALQKVGDMFARGAQHPATRAAADVGATREPTPGVPVGGALASSVVPSLADVAQHARHLVMP